MLRVAKSTGWVGTQRAIGDRESEQVGINFGIGNGNRGPIEAEVESGIEATWKPKWNRGLESQLTWNLGPFFDLVSKLAFGPGSGFKELWVLLLLVFRSPYYIQMKFKGSFQLSRNNFFICWVINFWALNEIWRNLDFGHFSLLFYT